MTALGRAYEANDHRYRQLRRTGAQGWSEDESPRVVEDMLGHTLPFIQKYAPPNPTVLELGCGDGSFALELAARGFDCAGIDISPTAIGWAAEKARRKGVEVDLYAGSVLELPFADGIFDVVVDGHCGHCIIPGDRERFFSEARRVLRPGGLFVMLTMCGEPRDPFLRAAWEPSSRCVVRRGIAGRHLGTREGILVEMAEAGFAAAESYVVSCGGEGEDELVAAGLVPQRD